jgi:hypothetical protein
MDPEEAYEKIEASRLALFQTVEGLSEEDLLVPQVEGIWTIKDLLSHITAWEDECLRPLRNFIARGEFDSQVIEDHDAYNMVLADKKQRLSLRDVMKDLVRIRLELLAQCDMLSEAQWEQPVSLPWGQIGTMADMLSGLAWHENEHVKTIQHWLATRTGHQV